MTQLDIAIGEHRHEFAVTGFERGITDDINDLEFERGRGLQRAQARDHVITQMAIRAAVDGQY